MGSRENRSVVGELTKRQSDRASIRSDIFAISAVGVEVRVKATIGDWKMAFTTTQIAPIAAIVAGILILIMPDVLNYIVAIYLIVIGLIGLNDIYHFIK
jgi:hypothetical protein